MTPPDTTDQTAPKRGALLSLLFAGFVLSGVATTIIGPVLPIFIRRWSLDDGQAGLFSSVQFLAALVGTMASSAIISWRGYKPALVAGYVLMGVGLAALNADTRAIALVATAGFGLGYGLLTPGTNLFVAELGGAKSASLLSLLNFTWGAGAMACSPLMSVAIKGNAVSAFLLGFAIFGVLVAAGILVVPFGSAEKHGQAARAGLPAPKIGLAVTAAMAALFFLYVAMETSVGVWAAEYARRMVNGITAMTTLAPMFFYGGLSAGRAIAPLVLLRLSERKFALGALALAALGILSLVVSRTLNVAILSVFIAGLGCAALYPIYIAWLSRWYGASAKKIGGFLFALASLGGSAGPGMVGFVSKYFSSLSAGLCVPLAGALVMFVVVLLLRKQPAG